MIYIELSVWYAISRVKHYIVIDIFAYATWQQPDRGYFDSVSTLLDAECSKSVFC